MCAPTKNASTVSQFNKRFYLWIYLAADYEFEFLTGTNSASATDTELYVKYQGTEGELIFYFDGSGSVFSIGGTDTFERDGPSVGKFGQNNSYLLLSIKCCESFTMVALGCLQASLP